MKKILYSAFILAAGLLSSCNDTDLGGPKNEVEKTATEALAGEWYVQAHGVDADDNILYEDVYGAGTFEILTYNTAANTASKMIVDDETNFWEFKGEVNCNIENLTFSATGISNAYYESSFDITEGKILLGAATSSYGHKVDSICFRLLLDDDDYAGKYYDHLLVTGYRRTGFDQGED